MSTQMFDYNRVLGVAGGSGAGKSTLAQGLKDRFPDQVAVLHFDDYQKLPDQIPIDPHSGLKNWDCPEAIEFSRLVADLGKLQHGQSITLMTKDRDLNPNYAQSGERVAVNFEPKPIVLLEGYLALYDAKVRQMFDVSIFLELDHQTRMQRRDKFLSTSYEAQILIPMHEKFVVPTREKADLVVDATQQSPVQVLAQVIEFLTSRQLLII